MKLLTALAFAGLFAQLVFSLHANAQTTPFLPDTNKAGTNFQGPVLLHTAGIENLFRLSDRVYSGAAPEGVEGFAALQKLGVKTIISVDGSKPDTELAHKFGLHYVHLPHGYDGIPTNVQLALIKAAETLPGPIFVHCHHGKHRGPAAAAVICMGTEGWSPAEADAWLKTAGTATNYVGLFETVQRFHPPSDAELKIASTNFPETATVSDLVDAMVAIDQQWDNLKAVRKANYTPPADKPDLRPANEALILGEHFREAQRLPESNRKGKEFLDHLKAAETSVWEAETLLQQFSPKSTPEIRAQLDRHFDAIGQSCVSCHKAFRDNSRGNAADLASELSSSAGIDQRIERQQRRMRGKPGGL